MIFTNTLPQYNKKGSYIAQMYLVQTSIPTNPTLPVMKFCPERNPLASKSERDPGKLVAQMLHSQLPMHIQNLPLQEDFLQMLPTSCLWINNLNNIIKKNLQNKNSWDSCPVNNRSPVSIQKISNCRLFPLNTQESYRKYFGFDLHI